MHHMPMACPDCVPRPFVLRQPLHKHQWSPAHLETSTNDDALFKKMHARSKAFFFFTKKNRHKTCSIFTQLCTARITSWPLPSLVLTFDVMRCMQCIHWRRYILCSIGHMMLKKIRCFSHALTVARYKWP